jgi:hypothetical protein
MDDNLVPLIRSRLGESLETVPFRVARREGVAYRATAPSAQMDRTLGAYAASRQ